ncbi:MAG: hypothetical protein ACREGJ_03770 [Candidatus Saccharimonadales bacterium]
MELRSYVGGLRDVAVRAKVKPEATTEQPFASEFLKSFLETASAENDRGSLENLVDELEQKLEKSPVVHLTFAVLPNRAVKRQLTLWFRTEIHPDCLLTFVARSDIGGGAILQAGSHMYDFSFKRQILDNKARISELAGV